MTRLKMFALLMLSLVMLFITRDDDRDSEAGMPVPHDVARWGSQTPPQARAFEHALVAMLSQTQARQAAQR